MPVEQIPTIAEAVVQHGAGAAAVATMLGMAIWGARFAARMFERFADKIVKGDGNGGPSLIKVQAAVEEVKAAADAAAATAHETAMAMTQTVSCLSDLKQRMTDLERNREADAVALNNLAAKVDAIHCTGVACRAAEEQ